MKNLVISSLLIYIFAQTPGWAVEGMDKLTLCAFLSIILALALCDLERIVRKTVRGLKYAVRK